MNFLRGFILSLAGLLLFFSISAFGAVLMLRSTLLNPSFVYSHVETLDVSSLTKDLLGTMVPHEQKLVADALANTVADLGPWIKSQARNIVYSSYDYLSQASDSLNIVVPLQPVKDSLKANLQELFPSFLPTELVGVSPEVTQQYFDRMYQQTIAGLSDTLELNQSLWGPGIQTILEYARSTIGFLGTAFVCLIFLIPLLVLCIVFLSRPKKAGVRRAGVIFLTYGILQFVAILIIIYLVGMELVRQGLPVALRTWAPQFVNDLLAPLRIFSVVCAVGGTVLIITGAIPWGRKETVPQTASLQVPPQPTSRFSSQMLSRQGSTCIRCGAQNSTRQSFCGNCGAGLSTGCPACGAVQSTPSRFCTNCGARLF